MRTVVEIAGIGFPNKGAELMLAEVCRRLHSHFGAQVSPVCRPSQTVLDSSLVMGRMGVRPLAELTFRGVEVAGLLDYLPGRLISPFGVSRRRDVDVVLDASGLRYSEDWGVAAIERGEKYLKMKARLNQKIILLPQAFGPFLSDRSKDSMRRIIALSDRIYARDRESYAHLRELSDSHKIIQCPDLTIGCHCIDRSSSVVTKNAVVMIPNQRMRDKGEPRDQANYMRFMLDLARQIIDSGERLVLLNHEGKADRDICDHLKSELGIDGEVLEFLDPLELKASLACAKAVVTSRFHGAVSALSQGVPCCATSWSHKYEMLFEDFGVGDFMINLNSSGEAGRISKLINDSEAMARARTSISEAKGDLLCQVEAMWSDVFDVVAAPIRK